MNKSVGHVTPPIVSLPKWKPIVLSNPLWDELRRSGGSSAVNGEEEREREDISQ
jgi:hypothetical protein